MTAPIQSANASSNAKEVFFAICPTPVASHVAFDQGWLNEEIEDAGGRLTYLRSIPDTEKAWPHVRHAHDAFIRDGGNSPAIWARADVSRTRLIGVTFVNQSGGELIVRADSDIYHASDLKGRRVGVIKGLNTSKIDFLRAPQERGVELALRLAGLTRDDVKLVDIPNDDREVEQPSTTPAERLVKLGRTKGVDRSPDVQALSQGRVDAIFARGGKTEFLVRSGEFKVIADLGAYPDWTLRANNTPYVLTVSEELAANHPDLVVAYLRASIRAGRWINANRRAAAEIFNRTALRYPDLDSYEASLGDFDYVPNLSPVSLGGVTVQKDWLLNHGYIRNDFDVEAWADHSFLDAAHASLGAPAHAQAAE